MADKPLSWKDAYPYLSNVKMPVQLMGLASLLNPLLDKISAQRSEMWSGHLPQAQMIMGSEHPRLYTGYESVVGEYEHDTTARDQDIQITEVIPRFVVNHGIYPVKVNPGYTVIYRGTDDNKIGYFNLNKHTTRSAEYGYQNIWLNSSQLNKGNFIPKDMKLCTSPSHEGNKYKMGTNLKVAFMSLPQVTKDAFVISESAADKLTTVGYEKISFKILPDQIPLDLYGNEDEYKFFPDIGEHVREDGIICALRAPTADTFVSDMTKENLARVQPLHDTVFCAPAGAEIVDVDVIVNRKCKIKTPKEIFNQVQKYRSLINGYCIKVWEAYRDAVNQNLEITPAFNSLVTRCISSLLADNVRIPGYAKRAEIILTKKKEPIEFVYITLTYRYIRRPQRGFKVSDRFGGKGTISDIVPDVYMPKDQYGNTAELIADEVSIFNRMNPGKFYEQAINATSAIVTQRIQGMLALDPKNWMECWNYLIDYLRDLNPNYADKVEQEHPNPVAKQDLLNEICRDGIIVQMMGFTEGIDPEKIQLLRQKYNLTKGPVTFGVKMQDETWKQVTSKKSVLIGEQYFYLLYKMPHQRASGLSYINQYRTPIRPSALTKLQFPFAQTPIRLGEDEIRNLQMIGGPELPARILGLYANSTPAVNMLAEHLLFAKDPAQLDHINMTTADIVNTNAIVGVAQHIFSCFGVSISTNTAKLDFDPYGDIELPEDKG